MDSQLRKDIREIVFEVKELIKLNSNGSIDPYQDGSFIDILINTIVQRVDDLQVGLEIIQKLVFYQTAEGEFLEFHADLVDLKRIQPSKAMGEVDVKIKGAVNIVKGYKFLDSENNIYITTSDLIETTPGTYTVGVIAQVEGSKYNQDSGTTLIPELEEPNIESIVATNGIAGGKDLESDESLRVRIGKAYAAYRGIYNRDTLEEFIRQDSNIKSIKFSTPGATLPGGTQVRAGESYIYFTTTNNAIPNQASIDLLKDRLLNGSILPVNTDPLDLFVEAPPTKDVRVKVSGLTPNIQALKDRVNENVKYFFNNDLSIGMSLSRELLSLVIFNSELDDGTKVSSFTLEEPVTSVATDNVFQILKLEGGDVNFG